MGAVGTVVKWICTQRRLLAQAEVSDHLAVAFDVLALQVVEEASSLADELEQAAPGVVVLWVCLEVVREVGDALCDEGDLNLGGACVCFVATKRGDDVGLEFWGKCHGMRFFATPR